MPRPAIAGSRAEQSYTPGADLSWSTVPPPCQREGAHLSPRKLSHGRRRKGSCQLKKLNTGGSIDREPPHSSNMRSGRKRQKKSWNPVRFFSFFPLPKLLLGMGGGRKEEGLHDTKETAQS